MSKKYIFELLENFYISKNKKVRKITLETYVSRLTFLNKLLNIDNVEKYLKYMDYVSVIETLELKYTSLSSITTSISSILILLQAVGIDGHDITIVKYREYLSKIQDKKNIEKHTQLNTVGVLKINKEKINNLKKEFEKINKKINLKKEIDFETKNDIQNYLLFCLYTMQPPVRNDYCNMKVIGEYKDDLCNDFNYILRNKDNTFEFIFKNYKTVGLYGTRQFTANKKLTKVLNKFVNFCGNGDFLFTSKNGMPYSKSNMGQKVVKIFGVGITELRKYYLSNQFQILFGINKEINETSKMMMNSKSVIISNYLQLLQVDGK
jgi:hypothetical protein